MGPDVVPPGFDAGDGGHGGDRSGSTGSFVASARLPGEGGVDGGDESAQLALAEEQLADEVPHLEPVDLGRIELGVVQCAEHRLLQPVEGGPPDCGPALGEVGLISAEDVDPASHDRRASSCSWSTQHAWNPWGTRWGIWTRPTSVIVGASTITHSECPFSWSATKLMR